MTGLSVMVNVSGSVSLIPLPFSVFLTCALDRPTFVTVKREIFVLRVCAALEWSYCNYLCACKLPLLSLLVIDIHSHIEQRDQRLGKVIFYGYMVDGQNFVSNWRPAGADPGMLAWECAFSMSRRREYTRKLLCPVVSHCFRCIV